MHKLLELSVLHVHSRSVAVGNPRSRRIGKGASEVLTLTGYSRLPPATLPPKQNSLTPTYSPEFTHTNLLPAATYTNSLTPTYSHQLTHTNLPAQTRSHQPTHTNSLTLTYTKAALALLSTALLFCLLLLRSGSDLLTPTAISPVLPVVDITSFHSKA